jgi:hypothetical protein
MTLSYTSAIYLLRRWLILPAMDHYKIIDSLGKLMDKEVSFMGFGIGLDPLLGLVPGIGDFASLLISLYIIYAAKKLRIPEEAINKMVANVVFDFFLGLVPFVGDVADFFYKANMKNIAIIRQHYSPIIDGTVVE